MHLDQINAVIDFIRSSLQKTIDRIIDMFALENFKFLVDLSLGILMGSRSNNHPPFTHFNGIFNKFLEDLTILFQVL